jgi:hypothetical protein
MENSGLGKMEGVCPNSSKYVKYHNLKGEQKLHLCREANYLGQIKALK